MRLIDRLTGHDVPRWAPLDVRQPTAAARPTLTAPCSSDDSSAYRSAAAVESIKKLDSPLFRMRRFLESRSPPLWSAELEESTKAADKKRIMVAFAKAEGEKKPPLDAMWGDVYATMERPQREQRDELKRLVGKWGETKGWKKELERFQGGKEAFLKA